MKAVEALRASSEFAFQELWLLIESIDEPTSWATCRIRPGEYLHSNGSIVGMVQHLAGCKMISASRAFYGDELKGRDVHGKMVAAGSDWEESKGFLLESHDYWMAGWRGIEDDQLNDERNTIWNRPCPIWKQIARIMHHDKYHAGQIQLLQVICEPSDTAPDMAYDEEERSLRECGIW